MEKKNVETFQRTKKQHKEKNFCLLIEERETFP